MDIEDIRKELDGYHVEIKLFPSGGVINVHGCEECKTLEDYFDDAIWGKTSERKTIREAVEKLKKTLPAKENEG